MTTNTTPQHHIIKETSDTLTRLFQDEFKRNGYKRVHIVDGAPKPDAIEGKLPAVSVYLYQIALDPQGAENMAVHEIVELKQDDGSIKEFTRKRRMWVRLDYLASAWAQTPEDEQLLCGLLLRTIIDHAEISKDRLKGTTFEESMAGYEFDGLPLNLNTRLDEGTLARFWGSLNQPIRPAIQFWTAVPIIPERMDEFQRVRSRQIDYRNINDPKVKETGPTPNPFARRLDLGGGRRGGGT
jgi:hypothetical protein